MVAPLRRANLFISAALLLAPGLARAGEVLGKYYDFPGGSGGSGGSLPSSPLVAGPGGYFYGIAAAGNGAIFQWKPGHNARIIYSFCKLEGCSDGQYPQGTLAADSAGNIYGATFEGGIPLPIGSGPGGSGVVFKLAPGSSGPSGSWTETVLHRFGGAADNDGDNPATGVVLIGGNLYGTTNLSNFSNALPLVYELTAPTGGGTNWGYNELATLNNYIDQPGVLVAGPNGALFGTVTGNDGSGNGYIFEVTPPSGSGGWSFSTIHSFAGGADGGIPAGLFYAKPTLYGTTQRGGSNGGGTVYSWTSSAGETPLFSFSSTSGSTPGGLYVKGGNLFVTTAYSFVEVSNAGGVWSASSLYTFTGNNDGFDANTIITKSGKFYGSAYAGGIKNQGTVFQLVP